MTPSIPAGSRLSIRRAVRLVSHAFALIFCSWWLVATSAPVAPARDCFTGLGTAATVRVVLGDPTKSGTSQLPSCQGIDGLKPGAALTLTMSQGPRPQNTSQACYRYDTSAISGATDVSVGAPASLSGIDALTVVDGQFASTSSTGCSGTWSMVLRPASVPESGPLISPFDAGPDHPWFVEREITIGQAEHCGAPLNGSGEITCEDVFAVQSITR